MNAQRRAVTSSTAGYIAGIGSPPPRQRARSTSPEMIGMLSYQRRPCPHFGQRDGGRITDCLGSAPQRRMQTLRKLPIAAPRIPAYTTRIGSLPQFGSSAVTHDLVE